MSVLWTGAPTLTLTVINLNVLLRRTAPTDEEEVPDEGSLVVNAACSTDICRSMEIDGKTVVIVLHNNDMCKEPIFVQVVCTVGTHRFGRCDVIGYS